MNILYKIQKSKHAKRISIRITNEGETIVTLPRQIQAKHAHRFVEEKQNWIAKTLNKISSYKTNYQYIQNEKINFLGGYLRLNFTATSSQKPKAEISSATLNIYFNKNINISKKEIRNLIIKTMKQYFRTLVEEIIEEYNKIYNFQYNRIAIKDNKTNWGSCSTKKNLNFTWRLIFAPLDIIDYVVVHELCHLKEQNHSKNFWALLAKSIPDYKTRKKWLKENSPKLTF